MENASVLDTRVEAFAELMARLDAPFADRSAVLRDAGLDQAACSALQARYAARFAAPGPDAEALVRRFGDAYERARKAPDPGAPAERAAVPEEKTLSASYDSDQAAQGAPPVVEAPVALEMPPPSAVAPASAPSLSVPSFLKDRPGAASPAAPPLIATPAQAAAPLIATPAQAAAPPIVAMPPSIATPPIATPPAGHGTTGPLDLSAVLKKAVPFDPTAKPALAPSNASSPPSSKAPLLGDTADVDVGALARRVLAFSARPKAETPKPPSLTVDQYALLSAEIVLAGNDPSARAAVLARFGIDSADALTAEWRARFAADPVLSGRWSAMYAQHYARLRTERPGKP